MTCRHRAGDPDCSSTSSSYSRAWSDTPDSSNYKVLDAVQEGYHLIMKVKYPNCSKCSYEGTKILVYLHTTAIAAVKWKNIDPHFTDKKPLSDEYAPSPSARFPASTAGWKDALDYARSKK